jgi:hypothetical protein
LAIRDDALKSASLFLICSILICATALRAQQVRYHHGHGLDLSHEERQHLEERVKAGDAEAAWRLYLYYSFDKHEEELGVPWLLKAAQLKHSEAQRAVADRIRYGWPWYRDFGSTPQSAVQALLEDAASSNGAACWELAKAFEEGYFGKLDATAARKYYQRGADFGDRMCWKVLARYLTEENGGPRDPVSAYFWISLETRCTDPRSVDGKDSWSLRENIARHLSLTELEDSWKQIDSFIADVLAGKREVDPPAFLGTAIDDALRREGQCLADELEALHRIKIRGRPG